MNHISKPHLVVLLRIFDKRKYFVPRIRYASVRSKPELLRDLAHYYDARLTHTYVYLIARPTVPNGIPEIRYNLEERKYYFDEEEVDAPAASRQVPRFAIRREPVVLTWTQFGYESPGPEAPTCPLSKCKAAASLSESPDQGLMISKVAKHEACHVVVSLTVLLGEDQHVATHGDAVYQKNV